MIAEHLIMEAERFLQVGNATAAIERLRMLLAEEPDHAEAHALLAAALLREKRFHAAQYEVNRALALEPKLTFARLIECRLFLMNRKFRKAHQLLDELQAAAVHDPGWWFLRAELYWLEGSLNRAKETIEAALERDPEHEEARLLLGTIQLESGELDAALMTGIEVLRSQPDHLDAMTLVGRVYLERGDTGSARQLALAAISVDPTDAGVLSLLVAIKARENWFLGFWWRLNSWVTRAGEKRAILILVTAFALFRIVDAGLGYLGYDSARNLAQYAWLALCAYTWMSPAIFLGMMKKEIKQVQLSRDF